MRNGNPTALTLYLFISINADIAFVLNSGDFILPLLDNLDQTPAYSGAFGLFVGDKVMTVNHVVV